MRESWKRKPPVGSNLTSWVEAYRLEVTNNTYTAHCLYEAIDAGEGETPEEAQADFCENIRLKIGELADMLEFCARNQARLVKTK